jgi:hypothetical protein
MGGHGHRPPWSSDCWTLPSRGAAMCGSVWKIRSLRARRLGDVECPTGRAGGGYGPGLWTAHCDTTSSARAIGRARSMSDLSVRGRATVTNAAERRRPAASSLGDDPSSSVAMSPARFSNQSGIRCSRGSPATRSATLCSSTLPAGGRVRGGGHPAWSRTAARGGRARLNGSRLPTYGTGPVDDRGMRAADADRGTASSSVWSTHRARGG